MQQSFKVIKIVMVLGRWVDECMENQFEGWLLAVQKTVTFRKSIFVNVIKYVRHVRCIVFK